MLPHRLLPRYGLLLEPQRGQVALGNGGLGNLHQVLHKLQGLHNPRSEAVLGVAQGLVQLLLHASRELLRLGCGGSLGHVRRPRECEGVRRAQVSPIPHGMSSVWGLTHVTGLPLHHLCGRDSVPPIRPAH